MKEDGAKSEHLGQVRAPRSSQHLGQVRAPRSSQSS